MRIKRLHFFAFCLCIVTGCTHSKSSVKSDLIVKIKDNHVVDKLEYGEIIYKSKTLDTLKLSEDDTRYLWFHFGIFNSPKTITELEKYNLNSYKSINYSVVPFESKFDAEGIYYLEGYLEEVILLDHYYNSADMREINKKIKISKKILYSEK